MADAAINNMAMSFQRLDNEMFVVRVANSSPKASFQLVRCDQREPAALETS